MSLLNLGLALSPLLGPLFVGSQCGNRIGLEFDFPSVLSIRVLVAWSVACSLNSIAFFACCDLSDILGQERGRGDFPTLHSKGTTYFLPVEAYSFHSQPCFHTQLTALGS